MWRRKVNDLLREAAHRLQLAGSSEPYLEAELLLAAAAGVDRPAIWSAEEEKLLTPEVQQRFAAMLARRIAREPLAYITGKKEFLGINFHVQPGVLIPRPESELLVLLFFKWCWETSRCGESSCRFLWMHWPGERPSFTGVKAGRARRWPAERVVVDVGTGSGALAVSLAYYCPQVKVYALDISDLALKVADENRRYHGLEGRVKLLAGDLLAPLSSLPELKGKIEAIIANLPYIPTDEVSTLMPDVRCYEPLLALVGGKDGLELYRRLVPQAEKWLRPGGLLLMEIQPGQEQRLLAFLSPSKWQHKIWHDLAGKVRVVAALLKESNSLTYHGNTNDQQKESADNTDAAF